MVFRLDGSNSIGKGFSPKAIKRLPIEFFVCHEKNDGS
jgi:hypothetical protein